MNETDETASICAKYLLVIYMLFDTMVFVYNYCNYMFKPYY